MRLGRSALVLVALAGCGKYGHGCSTEARGVETHGSIVVRHFAQPYEAAKGKRFREWCEIEIGGKPFESPQGNRIAQGCTLSKAEGVEAFTNAWQEEDHESSTTLVEIVGGRPIVHPSGAGESAWLGDGKLYVSGGHVFDLVHHTDADLHRTDLWQYIASPDATAVAAHASFEGPTVDFVVVRLDGAVVRTQKLVRSEHAWLTPKDGTVVRAADHTRWVKGADGTYDLAIDPDAVTFRLARTMNLGRCETRDGSWL